MRIGNWLGGSVIMALAAIHGMAATARTAEHVTTVPIGGSLDGQSGDRYSASTFRRGSAASSRSRRRRERSSSSKDPTARRWSMARTSASTSKGGIHSR